MNVDAIMALARNMADAAIVCDRNTGEDFEVYSVLLDKYRKARLALHAAAENALLEAYADGRKDEREEAAKEAA